tara:strand:+ start:104 stop:763 length:660 start_codon:yes stop_codon:yes gene_type:complete
VSNYTYWNLWSTPLFESFDEKYDEIKNDAITYCVENHGGKERSHVASGIKSELYESDFSFFKNSDNDSIRHIENIMKTTFENVFLDYFQSGHDQFGIDSSHEIFSRTYLDIKMEESWIHMSNDKGSWHGTHDHPMTSWAGIYYLKVDEVKGNGGHNLIRQPFKNMYKDFGNFFQHEFVVKEVTPENGKMVFFPANILHNATPYYGVDTRMVIATNINVY